MNQLMLAPMRMPSTRAIWIEPPPPPNMRYIVAGRCRGGAMREVVARTTCAGAPRLVERKVTRARRDLVGHRLSLVLRRQASLREGARVLRASRRRAGDVALVR